VLDAAGETAANQDRQDLHWLGEVWLLVYVSHLGLGRIEGLGRVHAEFNKPDNAVHILYDELRLSRSDLDV
jgi:hypothetical protein